MKPLRVLVCCLSLLAISVPALRAADAEAPEAGPIPSPDAPATAADALQLGPYDAPVATASCTDYYYYGPYRAYPADAEQACADLCAQNGDTYYYHLNLGYVFHECWCCPS